MPDTLITRKAIFTLCCGLLISLAVFFTVKNWEETNRLNDFNFKTQDHAAAIKTEFRHAVNNIAHIRALVEYDINVEHESPNNPDTFMPDAATVIMGSPGLVSLAWAIKQTSATHQPHLHTIYLKQFDNENRQVSNSQINDSYDEYVDLPLLLHPTRLLTTRIHQDSGSRINELLFIAPVADRIQSHAPFTGRHIGSLVIEINIRTMFEHALASTPVGALDVSLHLLHPDGRQQNVYQHISRSRTAADMNQHTDFHSTTTFTLAGQQWQLAFEAAPKFLRAHPVVLAWQSLAFCLLLTLFVTGYSQFSRRQSLRIEQQVIARTKEVIEGKKNLRRIMDHLQDVYFQVDAKGIIKTCSPSVFDLIGYTEEAVIGTHIVHYYANPELREILLAALRHSEDGKLFDYEVQALHQNGQFIWTSSNVQCTYDAQGKLNGIEGFVRNISAKKLAEQEREAMQRQIEHAQRLESLGVLAGGIAHDFNNILAAIMGNASLAERKICDHPEAGKEYLAQIVASSKQAAGLCQQMLAYAGKGRFMIESVNLSLVLQQMAGLLRMSMAPNVRLYARLQDPLPYVQADKTQIEQVVMNFIMNASEAIENEGKIILRTGVRHLNHDAMKTFHLGCDNPQAGDYVFLSVIDTGCGMDQATITKIFDPFFTTKFTGRGLGMSAVLGIVKGHDGLLKCKSTPGKGTMFTIYIPVGDVQPDLSQPDDDTSSFSANETQEIKIPFDETQKISPPGTALVIDDELFVRTIAQGMFKDLGWKSISAVDGASGVALFKKHQQSITAVLLDMTMPGMDGLATFDAISAIDPGARVILSTGYSEAEATERFAGKGLAGFLQKPYTVEQLQAKLARLHNTS